MKDSLLSNHDNWVAKLFQQLVEGRGHLDWKQEAPNCFLVYAHDNPKVLQSTDAEKARLIIAWLNQVGINIYSDRTSLGNPIRFETRPQDEAKVHDILNSQLGLLPTNVLTTSEETRKYVILCDSALLRYYVASDYYQKTYYPRIQQAYQKAQDLSSPNCSKAATIGLH